MKTFKLDTLCLAIASTLGFAGVAQAQVVINDTLTGTSSSYNWLALNGACLTAGTSFTISTKNSIPACRVSGTNLTYYSGKTLIGGATGALPDADGQGALRLTNGDTTGGSNGDQQTGAIVSNFTFPTNEGLQVTWTSVTYGGDGYGNNAGAASGADGISFFLSDGSLPATVGASGGSLGYSCSNESGNATWDGVQGGYLGIGIDEFGNFSSKSDNTSSGATTGQTPGQIVVRGSGNTTFAWLNANYPTQYPTKLATADRHTAVNTTCSTGLIYDFSTPSKPKATTTKLPHNYDYLSGSSVAVLKTDPPIYSQEAAGANTDGSSKAVRTKATPITYALTITQAGLLTFSYSINGGSSSTVLNNYPLTTNVGAMPASFRFGFSSGTGGGSNIHEITCFKAAPANISGSTAGSDVLSGTFETDSQVYLAYYHPINSWGSLTAQDLLFSTDSTGGHLTVSSTVNWDAGCVLTGGPCQAQIDSSGNAPTVAALTDNTTRSILSWDGKQGTAFEWSTASWASALGSSDELNYLRGQRSEEVSNTNGTFRTRSSLLGDIVDSSPVWVGPPSFSYAGVWSDTLNPTAVMPEGSTSYAAFQTKNAGRLNVVYAGANDGMLHGFQAGSYDTTTGKFVQTTNTGKEVLAYVPSQVVATIKSSNPKLDFSNTSYAHNFFVDAAPSQGDLFYNGNWHTWIVGGLGPGGQAGGPIADTTTVETGTVFALEVTDPTTFSEANAATLVQGEWSSTSLNVAKACGGVSNCGDHLGASYGTPQIRRLHDGNWAVIFGNGLNSKSGTAGVFIVHISSKDGTQTVQYLDTGKGGTSGALNGIVQVTPVDLDGDHVVDYLYAGDVAGNVWRFDLTDPSSANWKVKSTPLFTTQSGQPISSGLAVDAVTTVSDKGVPSTQPRIIVAFGTGQKYPQTLSGDSSYPTTAQSIYGIWDADMVSWNTNSKVASQFQYASLTSATNTSVPAIVPGSGKTGNLLVHTIVTASGARTTDQTAYVCWSGSTTCSGSGGNSQMGWEIDLTVTAASGTKPAVAEQVLFNPLIVGHYFNTNTDIPTLAQALTCDSSSQQAFSMGVSMATGDAVAGMPAVPATFTYFLNYAVGTIGVATQATGTSSAVVVPQDGSHWLVFQKNDGTGGTLGFDPPPGPAVAGTPARETWTKMR